jgi:hypothetical protein
MAKFIVCIETDVVLPEVATQEKLNELMQNSIITKVFARTNSEEEFDTYLNLCNNAIKNENENKQKFKHVFQELFKVLMQEGLITPDGKFQFEKYETGSYIYFAFVSAKKWLDDKKVSDAETRRLIEQYKKYVSSVQNGKIVLTEENQAYFDECVSFVEKKHKLIWNGNANDSFISVMLMAVGKFVERYKHAPAFNFDFTLIKDKVKPSAQMMLDIMMNYLQDDPDFKLIMDNIQNPDKDV